jgi:hypothetical protein
MIDCFYFESSSRKEFFFGAVAKKIQSYLSILNAIGDGQKSIPRY